MDGKILKIPTKKNFLYNLTLEQVNELKEKGNIKKAKKLLELAIKKWPDIEQLWQELIQLIIFSEDKIPKKLIKEAYLKFPNNEFFETLYIESNIETESIDTTNNFIENLEKLLLSKKTSLKEELTIIKKANQLFEERKFKELVKLEDKNIEIVIFLKALSLYKLNQKFKSLKLLKRIKNLIEEKAILESIILWELDQKQESIEVILDALEITDSWQLYYRLGILFYLTGEYDEAKTCFLEVLKKEKNHIGSLFHLTNIYFKEENFSASKDILNIIIDENPNNIIAKLMLAEINIKINELEEAKILANQVLLLDAENAKALFLLAKILFLENEYKQALFYINKLKQIDKEAFETEVNFLLNKILSYITY